VFSFSLSLATLWWRAGKETPSRGATRRQAKQTALTRLLYFMLRARLKHKYFTSANMEIQFYV
jgi:hypothetical protein